MVKFNEVSEFIYFKLSLWLCEEKTGTNYGETNLIYK